MVIKSWHRHGVWTCDPTSLTTLSTMPRNIWTRYNFCPPNQMQQLVFLHLLCFKDFFLYRRSLTARQGSSNQSTSSQTQKSGLASPLPGGTCTHSFLPFHLHFFQCSSISFPVPPICELLCPTSSHPKTKQNKKTKNPAPGSIFHKRHAPVKFKGETCSSSYACFRLFPQVCFCWVGFSSNDERAAAAAEAALHAGRSTFLSSLPFKG